MKFIQQKGYVFVLAGVCLMWTAIVKGEEFEIPMKVGNKWIYTDHTITIMAKDDNSGWYGFTACPMPESLPEGTWNIDNNSTWDESISNWMKMNVDRDQFLMKNKMAEDETVMLDASVSKGNNWTGKSPIKFEMSETEDIVVVPAGEFICLKVETVDPIIRSDPEAGKSWTIHTTTWYADEVGVVKDSTVVTETGCDPTTHVSKLIRYEFK